MILGNRTSGWNEGLKYGYYSFLFNLFWSGAGYISLCLCMAEMTSTLPFSGGVFGFVRACIGPYNGFLVACCEFIYCTTYIVIKVIHLINIPTLDTDQTANKVTNSLSIVATFIICLLFNIIGGKPFFTLTSCIGCFVFILLMIYIIGTISNSNSSHVSFNQYGGPMIPMSWDNIMGARFYAGAQYNGLQYFPLLSSLLENPKEYLPRLLLITITIFIIMSVFVTTAAVAQEPGGDAVSHAVLPLQYGFQRIFQGNISALKWLDAPCQYGAIYCLFYCSGQQLFALSRSGLMPTFLDRTTPGLGTPYLCYCLSASIGILLSIITLYNEELLIEIKGISLIACFYNFILFFISYIIFRRKFSTLPRCFTTPYGDYVAIYGIINYLSASIALIFYSNINQLFLAVLAGYLILASIFFWKYLIKNQKFSDEERDSLFKAYLINANRKARQNMNNRFKYFNNLSSHGSNHSKIVPTASDREKESIENDTRTTNGKLMNNDCVDYLF